MGQMKLFTLRDGQRHKRKVARVTVKDIPGMKLLSTLLLLLIPARNIFVGAMVFTETYPMVKAFEPQRYQDITGAITRLIDPSLTKTQAAGIGKLRTCRIMRRHSLLYHHNAYASNHLLSNI